MIIIDNIKYLNYKESAKFLGGTQGRAKRIQGMKKIFMSKKNIAFCSGCFDALHAGHIYILSEARKHCNYLYVSINRDDYIIRIKNRRPINNCFKRRFELLNTGLVDFVEIRKEDSPIKTIIELQPNIIFVGSDYKIENVVGYPECLKWGGQVKIIERLPNISTTQLYYDKQ